MVQYGTGNRFSVGFLAQCNQHYHLVDRRIDCWLPRQPGDIVVGLIGAVLGGFLAGLLGLGSFGLLGTIIVAFIGACILLAILHAVSGRGRRL
jgi:hypothetical protein